LGVLSGGTVIVTICLIMLYTKEHIKLFTVVLGVVVALIIGLNFAAAGNIPMEAIPTPSGETIPSSTAHYLMDKVLDLFQGLIK